MKIIWTQRAITRIEEIADYIAKDKPIASKRWKSSIYKSVQRLKFSPKIGRIVPETNRNDIREILQGNYRIIYKIEENFIAILTVRHGKQLFRNNWIENG